MVAATRGIRVTPARTHRVLANLLGDDLLTGAVTEGTRCDEYAVTAADGAVHWTHRGQPGERAYRVECVAGRPVHCDCPSRVPCRHLLASRLLIDRGELTPPADEDDRPDGWCVQTEWE